MFRRLTHHRAHVLRLWPLFGARRTLWGECSDCDSSGSAEWKCPLAAEVFNALEGNSPGSRADIIELDGGSGMRSRSGLRSGHNECSCRR